jgi:hypothetical protein
MYGEESNYTNPPIQNLEGPNKFLPPTVSPNPVKYTSPGYVPSAPIRDVPTAPQAPVPAKIDDSDTVVKSTPDPISQALANSINSLAGSIGANNSNKNANPVASKTPVLIKGSNAKSGINPLIFVVILLGGGAVWYFMRKKG